MSDSTFPGMTVPSPGLLDAFEASLRRALTSPRAVGESIGRLGEKRMHAILKDCVSARPDEQEVPLSALVRGTVPAETRARKIVADVFSGGRIYEIQTGGFWPLRDKLRVYLEQTDYPVTLIHPVALRKRLSWLSAEDGSVISSRLSPRRGKVTDIASELYRISDFLPDPRFCLEIWLCDIDEYRIADGWSRDKKRGSHRYERVPTSIAGIARFTCPDDYVEVFLPKPLRTGDPFTAAEYAKVTKIKGRATYGVIHSLEKLQVLAPDGKIGRAVAYRFSPAGPGNDVRAKSIDIGEISP